MRSAWKTGDKKCELSAGQAFPFPPLCFRGRRDRTERWEKNDLGSRIYPAALNHIKLYWPFPFEEICCDRIFRRLFKDTQVT